MARGVQSVNFYHHFIPHCARILQPLNTMLAGTKPAQQLLWLEKAAITFISQIAFSLPTKRCQPIPAKWGSALPLVLLGIRTVLKQDLRCSATQLVYGTTLHLQGEFFVSTQSSGMADPVCYVAKLWDSMQHLCTSPTCHPKQRHDKALASRTHVFVRRVAV